MTPDPQQELRDLREEVAQLQANNQLLTQRTETLALLDLARGAFDRCPSMAGALDAIAELVSAIAGIDGTCVALVPPDHHDDDDDNDDDDNDDDHDDHATGTATGVNGLHHLRAHCGAREADPCPVFARLITQAAREGPRRERRLLPSDALALCQRQPNAAVLVHFQRPTTGTGMLIFSGAELDPEDPLVLYRLDELGSLLADLIESRALRDALVAARQQLEAKVVERTRQLAHERSRLRSIVHGAADGIVEVAPGGVILSVNPAFATMVGRSAADLLGRSLLDLTPLDDQTDAADTINKLNADVDRPHIVNKRYLRPDGGVVHAQIHVAKASDTSPGRAVIIVRDLTTQRATQRSMRRLQHAVDQSRDAVILTDPDGRISYVNSAFESSTGYALAEVRGMTPRVLKSNQHSASFYKDLWKTIKGGQTWQGRFTNRRKDGGQFQEETTITPFLSEAGQIEGYVAIKRDLTERIALEDQLRQSQKLEAIGQLASGVAHDFNNLLMPILIDGQFLRDALSPEDPRRDLADEILEAGERAKTLTRQLLAFGRRQVLDVKCVDLRQIVTGLQRVLSRVLREDVRLIIEPGDAPVVTKADVGQIEQVVMNLAVNAQDAMPMGGELRIRVLDGTPGPTGQTPDADLHWVGFEVQDTGEGMDEATARRATDPFFTTKARGKGTGLGLATCHGITHQHGGALTIASTLGLGTTVRVVLPACTDAAVTCRAPTHKGAAQGQADRPLLGLQVWLVEDDEAVARATQRLLTAAGAVVTTFGSADQLLDMIGSDDPVDLLITDVVLPGLDGHQLSEALRGRWPQLPVVYVSGYSDDVLAPRGILEPGVIFVQKPFGHDRLMDGIAQALGMG